jgi:hypothetical protein
MEEQHIGRMEDLIIALELMEPFGMAAKTGTYSLADAIDHYHKIHAKISADEYWREYHGKGGPGENHVCGEAIYGNGGWHRYYLRLDGYIYFSEHHAHEPAISNAKALGFRIN